MFNLLKLFSHNDNHSLKQSGNSVRFTLDENGNCQVFSPEGRLLTSYNVTTRRKVREKVAVDA